ncbi:MAG: SUMF1/EgtB/PvdO family nonheme iron enzyme, partial [bacterium]
DVSQREAAQKDLGLRFKLRIQSPELAALPWEFLYDARQAEYICLSRNTPVVRYIDLPQVIPPLAVTPPLRILGMMVSPSDLQSLDLDNEKHRVEEATKDLQKKSLVELTWLEGKTWRDLQKAMRAGPWHIFHFIGHGAFDRNAGEGLIFLEDEEGASHRLTATQLGRLLADHPSLRLALLNACEGARGNERDIFSSTGSILVRRGLPAVLAMQYEITDRAAVEFSRSFYEALAESMPVDAAVVEARKAISLAVNNTVEWGTPVLYMRAPDGHIFELKKTQSEQHAKSEEQIASASTTAKHTSAEKIKPRKAKTASAKGKTSSSPSEKLRNKAKTAQIEQTPPLDMVLIPAGSFMMGSEDGRDDEKPVHEVYIDAFYMDKYEVTVAKFKKFVEATDYKTDAEKEGWSNVWTGTKWDQKQGSNWRHDAEGKIIGSDQMKLPVINISWNDARTYAQWTGKRLPTEAEWEYAARSGSKGYKYSWGNGKPAGKKGGNIADEAFKHVFRDCPIWESYN